MSAADRAAEYEAKAQAARDEARLETDLLAAKQAYTDDPSELAKARKQEAAEALRAHRAETRSEGVSVGGDAYVDEPAGNGQPTQNGTTNQGEAV